ncbi:uncharacterized protein [Aegilops tauschii subsp. strangulata]|uniref:uncharacterized protein n=1 Tax=Aegilops tauschii subsp. strangulata TaxID=200361 RepID=UPI003CC88C88
MAAATSGSSAATTAPRPSPRYVGSCRCRPKLSPHTRTAAPDKAIKRYKVQNIVAPEGISYFTKASVLDGYHLPKIYLKERWCIGCAIHKKKIGIRSRKDRKNRAPPEEVRRRGPRPVGQAPRPGGVGGGPGGVGGGSGGTGGAFGAGGAGGGFGAGAPAPNVAGDWPQN